MSSSASVNSRAPYDSAERRREAVPDPLVVAQVDAERVLHHQVVDLGAVEQPLHRRVVGSGTRVTPVGAQIGSPPRRVMTQRAVASREVFDVPTAAHVELVRHAVRVVAVMREHRVRVDVRGVAVDLDVLVAEHVHRGVEDRDATDVGDHRVAIGEATAPAFDLEIGREARTHHLHVAAGRRPPRTA